MIKNDAELMKEIDELERDFYLSLQSSVSMNKLGVDANESYKSPQQMIDKLANLIPKLKDSTLQDLTLLKIIDMIDLLDESLEQI